MTATIEKVIFNGKKVGKTPYLYPLDFSPSTSKNKDKHPIRAYGRNRRKLDDNLILAVDQIYYKQFSSKGKINSIYLYFTDGKDIFRVDYNDLNRHLFVTSGVSYPTNLVNIMNVLQENGSAYETMMFFCL